MGGEEKKQRLRATAAATAAPAARVEEAEAANAAATAAATTRWMRVLTCSATRHPRKDEGFLLANMNISRPRGPGGRRPHACSASPSRARSVCHTASPKVPWACMGSKSVRHRSVLVLVQLPVTSTLSEGVTVGGDRSRF